ncbi:MAG: hypothetical protein MI920_19190 [Kiloniellales bacterium]|nr:hypothetical protein [Kiloniellales bacterium]
MGRRPAALLRLSLIVVCCLITGAPAAVLWAQNADGETAAEDGGETATSPQIGRRSGAKLPRFVALRAPEVNMRTGPGTRYPIDWVYQRRNLPVEIIDEYDTWRRVRDHEGTSGWIHQSMLHARRFVLITSDEGAVLRRDPQDDARPVALLETGVIGHVESCGEIWCVVEVQALKGWLRRDQIFGVYPDEEVR